MTHFLLLESLKRMTPHTGFGSSDVGFPSSPFSLEGACFISSFSSTPYTPMIPAQLWEKPRKRRMPPLVLRVQSFRNNYTLSARTAAGKTFFLTRGGYGKVARMTKFTKAHSVDQLMSHLPRQRTQVIMEMVGDRKFFFTVVNAVSRRFHIRRVSYFKSIPHNGVRTRSPRRK